jgi:signal transduction histidine kinase
MSKDIKQARSFSSLYRNYLILIASVIVFFFILLFFVFEVNKFTSASANLRSQIYKEKQQNIKNQVETAEDIIIILRDSLEERMHADLRDRVNDAYSIALNIYNVHKGKFSDKQIQFMIKEALRPIRFFDGRGYFCIIGKEGIHHLHPVDTSIEGTNVLNFKNSVGECPIKDIIKLSKLRDENYLTFAWKLVDDDNGYSHIKTSYTRNLPFFNWIIATGDYLEFQEDKIKALAIEKIGEMRYEEYGFVYINDMSGNILNATEEAVGKAKNLDDVLDADGNSILLPLVQAALQKGGGYFSYNMFVKHKGEVRRHQSFAKHIVGWDWVIGAFADMDTVEDLIRQNKGALYKELYSSILLLLISVLALFFIIWWISVKIRKGIESGLDSFYNEFAYAVSNKSYLEEGEDMYIEKLEFVREINSLLEINNSNILELERKERKLLILNASKDRFFSIIAHDLRNPFNSLLGILEILLEDYDSLDNDERKEYLKILNNSSNKLFKLLLELLQWARLQTSGIDCVYTKLDLSKLLSKELSNIEEQSRNKNINISIDIPANSIVDADEDMVSTIIRNLISNAIKFTHKNGKIEVRVNKEGEMLRFSIKDNGVGMSTEILGKLFKIEEKITSVGTNQEVGTGLGLILCKEFVEKNNGEIMVTSLEGEGSTFSFTLPIKQGKTEE